jgi:hydroxyacylglutathione hydrolase
MAAIIPVPAFTDNYIWLVREGGCAAVVDPGDAAPIIAYLEHNRLDLAAIVNTHHHGDHVGGNAELIARYGPRVFGPARENIPGRTDALAEGDEIELPGIGLALSVLDVPGHTAGHIAYVAKSGDPIAFVGDTLFACGCGRLFEGTPAQMHASLAKLAALARDTLLYCAHEYTLSNLRFAAAVEPDSAARQSRLERESQKRTRGEPTVPSVLADELATNPFLRSSEPRVMAAATAHAGRRVQPGVDTFAVLRAWKDRF